MTTDDLKALILNPAEEPGAKWATVEQHLSQSLDLAEQDRKAAYDKLLADKDASHEATIARMKDDSDAALVALTEKAITEAKAATLAVQTTYDALLSRAMAALATFPQDVQSFIAASPLAPVLAEAAAHTSEARLAANTKKRAELEAQLAAL